LTRDRPITHRFPSGFAVPSTGAPAWRIRWRELANFFELVYAKGFNSPSMNESEK
jgi:hypothetical protein